MSERRLKNEWQSAAFNRETNEWSHTTLQSYEHITAKESFTPATPAHVTPSRRKPAQRAHESIFVFGDAQIDYRRVLDHETGREELVPIHDERAIKLARYICKDLQPDQIINLGDSVDFASLSRFSPDSDHFYRTLGPSLQRLHDFYAELRSDNPAAKITEVDSNHNVRLKNYVLKYMPQLYNVRRAGSTEEYPVMSYPYLANLGHLAVNWVGGYGAAEYIHNDDLAFMHGTMSVSQGSTAAKLSKANPDRSVVQGHAHRSESFHRTDRQGKVRGAYVVGALCKTTGEVPSYWSSVDDNGQPVRYQENWTNSVMHIKDYKDGNYQFDHIMFRPNQDNGLSAFYDGKEYQS